MTDIEEQLAPPTLTTITILVFTLWLALWGFSMLMEYAPHASIWFPPAGLTFAAYLLVGLRATPGLVLVIIVTSFLADAIYGSQQGPWVIMQGALLFALAHCFTYGFFAWLLKQCIARTANLTPFQATVHFLIIGVVMTCLGAWIAIEAMRQASIIQVDAYPSFLLAWWIGDLAGVLVLTPMLLALLSVRYSGIKAWMGHFTFRTKAVDVAQLLTKIGVTLLVLVCAIISVAVVELTWWAACIFAVAVPLFWIVQTESPLVSAVTLAVLSFTLALLVDLTGSIDSAFVFQGVLLLLTVITWLMMSRQQPEAAQGAE